MERLRFARELKIKILARNVKIKILARNLKIKILSRNLKMKVNLRFISENQSKFTFSAERDELLRELAAYHTP